MAHPRSCRCPSRPAVSIGFVVASFAIPTACLATGCRTNAPPREQADASGEASAGYPPYRVPAAAGDGWNVARAESVGLSIEKLGAMERAIRAGDFPKLTSVAIARQGKLVYEAYFGETDVATLHNTRSVTKTVTGMFLGVAIEKRLIAGVDTPITSFFPDKRPFSNPDPRKEKITLEDLLTMSSVLECNDWEDDSRGNEERMYVEKDWIKFTLDLPVRSPVPLVKDGGARADADDRAASIDAAERGARAEPREGGDAPHGRRFSYCTAGVGTLGGAIERAVKTPLADFAKSALFDPLGIEHASWRYSPLGLAFTGGGLGLRSRDLLKLAQLYLDGGMRKGARVVPESWVKRSVSPHARIDEKAEYGYLWWLRSFTASGKTWPAWFMSGNGGNKVVVVPDLRLVVVLTSVNYNAKGMHLVTDRLLQDHVLAAVAN